MYSKRLTHFLDRLHTSGHEEIERQVESLTWALHKIMSRLGALCQDFPVGDREYAVVASIHDWTKQELVDNSITEAKVELNHDNTALWLEQFRPCGHVASVLQVFN
jgi:hypothetical protein